MKKFTILTILWLVATITVSTLLIQFLMSFLLKMEEMKMFLLLPGSFILSGVLMILMLNITDRKNDKRLAQVFMIIKTIKNFVLLIAGLIMILVFGADVKSFLIITGIFYIIYLAFETICLFRFEKLLKNGKIN